MAPLVEKPKRRRVREALAFAFLACACGVAARPVVRSGATTTPAPTTIAAPAPNPTAPASPTSFGDLEVRWAGALHGMHVVATRDSGLGDVDLMRADTGDQCLRVAFDASEPVEVSLSDPGGAVLAGSRDGTSGLLGPDGPVCIRKGATLRASAKGPSGTRVRWVAWSAGP